jgi:putative ABC transport system permease protein
LIFEYEFKYGDPTTAENCHHRAYAQRQQLCKEENPLGQTIKVGDLGTYTVTGVLERRQKSHIMIEDAPVWPP